MDYLRLPASFLPEYFELQNWESDTIAFGERQYNLEKITEWIEINVKKE